VTGAPCRRVEGGAGAVFRRIDAGGEGGSGTFPAASLSNIDSWSESWLNRDGAGGSGLFTSVADRVVPSEKLSVERGAELSNAGVDALQFSFPSSSRMSFPCRELGGGGFFLSDSDAAFTTDILRRSSSGSDTSCDVLGDSGIFSCIFSKIDCLDVEDVSVLVPSATPVFVEGP
jgi:hypothetical protein